jgi:sec-independent protein translocase protein TatC
MSVMPNQVKVVEVSGCTQDNRMSLVGHLQELRQRLIRSIIGVLAGSLVSFCFIDSIMIWLVGPAGRLYYLSPAEAFFTYVKVSFIAGFLVALPLVLYELWSFLLPAFTTTERDIFSFLVPMSVLLFYLGLGFAYVFVLPAAIGFFCGFAGDSLQPLFSLGQYVSFVLSLIVPFGLVFEMPLFILVLAQINLISSLHLIAWRRYAVVMAFVIGGVVSPTPDIFGQAMLAIPIILLYEISLAAIKYVLHK